MNPAAWMVRHAAGSRLPPHLGPRVPRMLLVITSPDVSTFLALLIVVAFVAAIVRIIRLPYEIALVLAGFGVALLPNAPAVAITPSVFLTVFLPVLLFHSAYNLPLKAFRANLGTISLLALPGVAITAGVIGAALHLIGGLSWSSAMIVGAILGATDPISVLSIFEQVDVPQDLKVIVNGESLFNDGIALVLFTVALQAANGAPVAFLGSAGQVAGVVAGSTALGAAIGLAGAHILGRFDDALLETTITLIIAYGGYLLADHLALSGPLETVTAGILLSTRSEAVMGEETRARARTTWEFLDFLANSLVFLLMGLAVHQVGKQSGSGLLMHINLLVIAIAAMLVARALALALAYVLARRRHPLPPAWGWLLHWAGLRGAISLAAALSIPAALDNRGLLRVVVFGAVLYTLLVQGLTIKPLLGRLPVRERE